MRWDHKGSEEGAWMFHRVGLSQQGNGSRSSPPILSTHSEYFLSDFPYEKPDRHHMPDDCRASWKCGDVVEC